jgi:hypothetical protein
MCDSSIGVFYDPCAGMMFAKASLHIAVGSDRDPVLGIAVWHLGAGHVTDLPTEIGDRDRPIRIADRLKRRPMTDRPII